MKINSNVDPNNCYIFYGDAFSKKVDMSRNILNVSVSTVSHCGNFVEICYKDSSDRMWWSLGPDENDNGIDARLLMTHDQAKLFHKENFDVSVGDLVAIKVDEIQNRYTYKSNIGIVTKKFEDASGDIDIQVFDNKTMKSILIDSKSVMIISRKCGEEVNE